MADLSVKISDLHLKNPVMTASGTFGYGLEFADFVPLEEIGGIIYFYETLWYSPSINLIKTIHFIDLIKANKVSYHSFLIYSPHINLRVSKTGPSLHTHRLPSVVFSTQHRQAPTPQAIMFSNDASQGIEA